MVEEFFFSIFNFLYQKTHDLGISIIVFSFFVYLLILPFTISQIKSQKRFEKLQEELKKIKENCKNDKKAQTQAMLNLITKEKINPFPFFLVFLLQIPIMVFIYRFLLKNISSPQFSPLFLGKVPLDQKNFLFPFLIFVFQILQIKKPDFFQYFFLFFFFLILLNLPAGLNLYFLTFTLLSFLGQKILTKKIS